MFFHLGHISLSWCTCYVGRGRALGIHQGGATHFIELWHCVWGRGQRGNSAACLTLTPLSVTSPASHKWILPLKCCPGTDSQVGGLVYIGGPCGFLQQTLLWHWHFLPLLQPPEIFTARGFEAIFPMLDPWVVWSVSLPICSSWFICMWMWDCLVRQLPPCPPGPPARCLAMYPLCPGCLSLPLLSVWISVSSFNSFVARLHTVQFSGSSVLLFFLIVCYPFCCTVKQSVSTYASIFWEHNYIV